MRGVEVELKPVTQTILGFAVLFAVIGGTAAALSWAGKEVSRVVPGSAAAAPLAPAPIDSSDPRLAAAIIALAEDNVKLRTAHASCDKSRTNLEAALKRARAK
jgi:hypothetical protein